MSNKKQICYKVSNNPAAKLINHPKIHSYDVYKTKKINDSNDEHNNLNLIMKDDFPNQFKKLNQNNYPKYTQNFNEITKLKFQAKNRNESSNNNITNIKLTKKINQDFTSGNLTYRKIDNTEISNRKILDLKSDSRNSNSIVNKIQINCGKINNTTDNYPTVSKDSEKMVLNVKLKKIKKDKILIDSENVLVVRNKVAFKCHDNTPEELHFFYVKNIQYGKRLEGHEIEGE